MQPAPGPRLSSWAACSGALRSLDTTARTLLAIAVLANVTSAHDVTPASLELRPGGCDYIFVQDTSFPAPCPATITVTSKDPMYVTIQPVSLATFQATGQPSTQVVTPNAVDAIFKVTANASLTMPAAAMVEVCWVGSTAPNPPCDEDNCGSGFGVMVPITIRTRPLASGAQPASATNGDPVNTSTGALFSVELPDLELPGAPFPLAFRRFYDSAFQQDGNLSTSLGPNWSHNFHWRLTQTGFNVEILTPSGRVIPFDGGFQQTSWEQVGSDDVPFQLTSSGSTFTLLDPRTKRFYDFAVSGELTRVKDGKGNELSLTYAGGLLSTVADGLGRQLTFTHDAMTNELTQVTDGTRTVEYFYTNGALTRVRGADGKDTLYAYDGSQPASSALLTSKTRPEGNVPFTQTWDAQKRVATQQSADGQTWTFAYQSGQTVITDPLSEAQTHGLGSDGEWAGLTDEAGGNATAQHDAKGRRTSFRNAGGDPTSITYHEPSGKLARVTRADGTSVSFTYAARAALGLTAYDLTRITNRDGALDSFQYDAAGNVIGHTDRSGEVWSWTYDARGQVLTATNPEGATSMLAYDPDGTLASLDDHFGNTTSFEYDGLGRATKVTAPDATTRRYTYDTADRVRTVEDELGRTSTLTYDCNGSVVMFTDTAGQDWTFGHDAMDRTSSYTDPLGNSLSLTFDELGRPMTAVDGSGDTTSFGYDTRGNHTTTTDGGGNVWSRAFDADGVPTSRSNPLGNSVTYTRDALQRITAVDSPLGHRLQVSYDAMDRVTRVLDPMGKATQVQYDTRGMPQRVSLASGAACQYERNRLGQITRIVDPGGNAWEYAYDATGRRVSKTDPLGNVYQYTYDGMNRLTRLTLPAGMGTLDCTYDAAGALTRQSYSDGTTFDYTYDARNRLTAADGLIVGYDAAGRIDSSNGLAVGRDGAGRIDSVVLAAGKTVTYAYDARGLLASVTDWVGGSTTFGYDVAGRLLTITRPNGVVTTYTYDADDRVTGIDEGALSSIALTRNAAGRVTEADRRTPLTATPAIGEAGAAFDAAGQVVGDTYDAMGRLTASGARTFTWDLASRLTRYQDATLDVTYSYDAAGMMLSRSEGGATQSYVWNYAYDLPSISVVRESGSDACYYVHTPGGHLLHRIEASDDSRDFYHYDELGNTAFLSDEAGMVSDAYAYAPYGEVLDSNGTTPNPFTFVGSQGVFAEADGALYFMRQRVYDSATGRFVQRDPIEHTGPRTVVPYTYANGNPLAYVDPIGASPRRKEVRHQVTIEAKFVTIEDAFSKEIGFDFGGVEQVGADLPAFGSSLLDDASMATILKALGSPGPPTIVSTPTLLTTGGLRASISLANQASYLRDFDYEVAEAASLSDPVVRVVQDGLRLDVVPTVSSDRRYVTLDLRPSIATVTQTLVEVPVGRAEIARGGLPSGTEAARARRKIYLQYLGRSMVNPMAFVGPGIGVRTLLTTVAVPDEGTVVLGGLRIADSGRTREVPVLGNLPLLRRMFSRQEDSNAEREILILLKPNILLTQEEE